MSAFPHSVTDLPSSCQPKGCAVGVYPTCFHSHTERDALLRRQESGHSLLRLFYPTIWSKKYSRFGSQKSLVALLSSVALRCVICHRRSAFHLGPVLEVLVCAHLRNKALLVLMPIVRTKPGAVSVAATCHLPVQVLVSSTPAWLSLEFRYPRPILSATETESQQPSDHGLAGYTGSSRSGLRCSAQELFGLMWVEPRGLDLSGWWQSK